MDVNFSGLDIDSGDLRVHPDGLQTAEESNPFLVGFIILSTFFSFFGDVHECDDEYRDDGRRNKAKATVLCSAIFQ